VPIKNYSFIHTQTVCTEKEREKERKKERKINSHTKKIRGDNVKKNGESQFLETKKVFLLFFDGLRVKKK
jgi:hypothetical protein